MKRPLVLSALFAACGVLAVLGPVPAPASVLAPNLTYHSDPASAFQTGAAPATVFQPGVITCTGTGSDLARDQFIYVHGDADPDHFATLLAAGRFTNDAKGMDSYYNTSAVRDGSTRHVRFVTNNGLPGCLLTVARLTVPEAHLASFSDVIVDADAAGYNLANRKYTMEVDDPLNHYCGIAAAYADSSHSALNVSNTRTGYSRIDPQCWGGGAVAHEFGHMIGAVQLDAPHSSGAYHCYDEADLMCYNDGGSYFTGGGMIVNACPAPDIVDCNADDYFNAGTVPANSYLALHWNTADSKWLIGARTIIPPPCPNTTHSTNVISTGQSQFAATANPKVADVFYNADCGPLDFKITAWDSLITNGSLAVTMYKADGTVCSTGTVSKSGVPKTFTCNLPEHGTNIKIHMQLNNSTAGATISWQILGRPY